MKAVVYQTGGPQKWWAFHPDFPIPAVPPGWVKVRVEAAALNPLDYKLPSLPLIGRSVMGKPVAEDFSGVVVDSQCSEFSVGDEVFGFGEPRESHGGTLCEFMVADPKRIARKPKSMSFAEAAAVPLAAVTSLQSLRDAGQLKPQQRVLLIGASGGTGTYAVQIAKALGAHVTAICSGRNREMVLGLGADEVHDYTSGSAVPAKTLPFDVVYDMVASPDAKDYNYEPEARPMLKPGGTYIAINGTTTDFLRSLISSRIGCNVQRRDFAIVEYQQSGADLAALADMADQGKLKSVIAEAVPFSEEGMVKAVEGLRGRRLQGKTVLVMRDGPDGATAPSKL